MRLRLLAPVLLLALALPCVAARADEDPLAIATALAEQGKDLIEVGQDLGDDARMREGVSRLRQAKLRFEEALRVPDQAAARVERIRAWLLDIESRLDWYAPTEGSKHGKLATGEVKIPAMKEGERIGAWLRRVRKAYDETDDVLGKAALARGMASKGGVVALPELFRLFETEPLPLARVGVHEALAMVGTSRVADRMASYASRSKQALWDRALEVVYLCLGKPQRAEPERPHLRTIRAFHELGELELSLGIQKHLHAMGTPGTAALGEILYLEDFGCHDDTIGMLATKRDSRAVPPLVHLMNRFKFEGSVQKPAHQALLQMGWYAVPELVERLDDRAAGIWISWTLRKITGETMGTDRRKWKDWWQKERVRHPELFDDPDERPGRDGPPAVTDGGK